jgi:putative spermidine/putrescine transport system substrate-binding protein
MKRVGVAAIMATSLLVAACGSSSKPSSSTATGGTSLKGQSAVFETFGGNIGDAIKNAFGDPAAKTTGLQVTYDAPTDYSKLQTQVQSGNVQWTFVEGDPWWSMLECGKLLAPVPASVNLSSVDPKYIVDKCEVPGDTWTFNMAYDPTKFKSDPPTSWADFFNTKKYPGKRAIWGGYVINGALEGALEAAGVPPNKLYPLDLKLAFQKLESIRKDTIFADTSAQMIQLMQSHQVVMAACSGNQEGWGGAFAPIWKGSLFSWDAYLIPKGANTAAAAGIANYMLTPHAQQDFVTQIPFGGVLKSPAKPPTNVSSLYTAWSPTLPAHAAQETPLDQAYYAKNYNMINNMWTSYVQGG